MEIIYNANWGIDCHELMVSQNGNGITVINDSEKCILVDVPFHIMPGLMKISLEGVVGYGTSASAVVCDDDGNVIVESGLNAISYKKVYEGKKYSLSIKIFAHTKVALNSLDVSFSDLHIDELVLGKLTSNIAVISPTYPAIENKYLSGFVHSRVQKYISAGIQVDVIVPYYTNKGVCFYEFEGISVVKIPLEILRMILMRKRYEKLFVHFFDEDYANIFESVDLGATKIYLWVHGPETLYWDWPKFTTGYFTEEKAINGVQKNEFSEKDRMIKKYNKMKNITWVFVSDWIRKRSQELIGIEFNNFVVIPNFVDEKLFKYSTKSADKRKNIFFIRRFDNCNKYAIDINVKTIIELSKRDCFDDLTFNIYGTGSEYEKLVAPIKDFNNVYLHPRFCTHKEIAEIHKNNGIGFFPTRYDAQGVSMCEAASSGLAIVTSDNDAVREFLPDEDIFAETENPAEYADIIERMYYDVKYFDKISIKCHEKVSTKCCYDATVQKEIEVLSRHASNKYSQISAAGKPTLSIVIPDADSERNVKAAIASVLKSEAADKIELIVVIDEKIQAMRTTVQEVISEYCDAEHSTVKFINFQDCKESSALSAGIAAATGKYTRLISGDDWFDSDALNDFVDLLSENNTDIVLTGYSEFCESTGRISFRSACDYTDKSYNSIDDILSDYSNDDIRKMYIAGTFNTRILKRINGSLLSDGALADSEYNIIGILFGTTVKKYGINLYIHNIGNNSYDAYIERTEQFRSDPRPYEAKLFNMLNMTSSPDVPQIRKKYIEKTVLEPLVNECYFVLCHVLLNRNQFAKFDRSLHKFSEIYYSESITNRTTKIHRKTRGFILPISPVLYKLYSRMHEKNKFKK